MSAEPTQAPAELVEIRRDVMAGDVDGASRSLLKSVGPRLLRDILGPTLSFYLTWKLSDSIIFGVLAGTAFALGAWQYERRQGRPGLVARLVLAFVVVQAVVGLVTGSAVAYLVQPAVLGAINGFVWLGSVAIGRPLAAAFAHEVFTIDDETKRTPEFRALFRHVSLLLGSFFVVFAAVQVVVLLIFGVGAFVAIRVAEVVSTLAVVVYCLRYLIRNMAALR